jgi:hypothetical protein
LTSNLVSKVLNKYSKSQLLINKDTNRGRFLFTFHHPFPKGTSVWVNSPWAVKCISVVCFTTPHKQLGFEYSRV